MMKYEKKIKVIYNLTTNFSIMNLKATMHYEYGRQIQYTATAIFILEKQWAHFIVWQIKYFKSFYT